MSRALGGYDDRYLAFIDVLGFSSIVARTASDPGLIDRVRSALSGITGRVRAARSTTLDIQATSFSDNVVLSLPATSAGLIHLFETVNGFSQDLLSLGMLFRGAIVRGGALHTEDFIFGPAMLEAYRLETAVSFHPRVMLDQRTFDDAMGYVGKSAARKTLIDRYLISDDYDVPSLNPFASWYQDDQAWQSDAIAKLVLLREIIARGLAENARNPNVGEKYRWLARKLDKFVSERRLAGHVVPLMS